MKYIIAFLIALFSSTQVLADNTLQQDILQIRTAWDHANYELSGSQKE